MTKVELETIKEQLNLERLLVDRFKKYSKTVKDRNLAIMCEEIASEHENHYETLKKCLEI